MTTKTKPESQTSSEESRKFHPTDPKKVKTGDIMTFVYYTKVDSAYGDGEHLNVTDLVAGVGAIKVSGSGLIKTSLSADQFVETVKVSKTALAQTLIDSVNRPFTVVFEKQDGTERVLRGRLVSHEALLGRSMVEDLDIDDAKKRMRLVDHRTLKSLIVDGVKYVVK